VTSEPFSLDPSPFALRGAIEAFYGSFYTFPQRNDLIRFLGQNGFNFYLYGPKNDRQHRMRWWDPYPDAVLAEFAETIWTARESGIRFCYAISFGVPMDYASQRDFDIVTAKLKSFYDRGCRDFSVLVDDITYGFGNEANGQRYSSVAEAHADISNRLWEWAQSLGEPCSLYICPTDYYGVPPFSDYLHSLGATLRPEVEVFYTGPSICSSTITADGARAFGEAVGRKPVIWDNYPANDLQMRPEMHVGPLLGRDPALGGECRGYAANLMNQAEASKISLLTIKDYLRNPDDYDPEAAWELALKTVGGPENYSALRSFAENSLGSCLQSEGAPEMDRLARDVADDLRGGSEAGTSTAAAALMSYFDLLDESCYHLKNRMRNLALRQDLLPWIEALEEKFWMGRGAIRCLRALEAGTEYMSALRFMDELVASISVNSKRIGGTVLLELPRLVHERVDSAVTSGTSQAAQAAGESSTAHTVGLDSSDISGAEGLLAHGHQH
jgi:hyaluronoglucosaminidase